jgi:AcrR family transcriptional regulator
MKQKDIALATRTLILEAACRVVLNKGVNALTLDSTAREAGVSKGGLLYHFPSKNSLITGMLERLISTFDLALDQELAKNNGNWLSAYVKVSMMTDPTYDQLSSALIAAIANEPELLKPLQDRFSEWQKRAEEYASSPEIGTLIRLAMDGLWISDLMGFAPPTPALRKKLLRVLLEMIEQ